MFLLMAAEIERETFSQRTKETLARRKAEGKQLGRLNGSYGVAKAAIAMMYGNSWQTVHEWVRRRGLAFVHN